MNESDAIQIIADIGPQPDAAGIVSAIKEVSPFSSLVHIDIDDGIFTPELSWPYEEKGRIGDLTGELDIPVDNFLIQVHLMVSDVREVGEFFARAGAYSIVVHVESLIEGSADVEAVRMMFHSWRGFGVREIGLAILLDTPMGKLDPLLPFSDFILVLSVATIGAQGAPFDPRAIERVSDLHTRLPDFPIAVDGGVSSTNIASLVEAGASRFSVGSAIMRSEDPSLAYAQIKAAAENALQ